MFPLSTRSRITRQDRRKEARRENRKNRLRSNVDFGRSILLEPLEERVVLTGTWSSVANTIPGGNGVGTMLLLSDGTIMATDGNDAVSKSWYKLTPDSTGSYANGTWTTLASMHQTRLFFGSAVLPDGRVFVVGGEYSDAGGDTNTGEIYNPVSNTWTVTANAPVSQLGDANTEVLPDGNVLVSHLGSSNTYIYNVSANTWSTGPALLHGDTSSEESWVKLSDGSILTYSIQGSQPQQGQRLVLDPNNNHANDRWYDAGTVPVRLDSNGGNNGIVPENGPAVRLADGRVLYTGASGHTALYTPPTTLTGTGSWVAGPDMKNSSGSLVGAFDAPAAVEVNGKVLIATGPVDGNNFPGPTTLQEYDPVANTMTIVPNSGGPDLSNPPFVWRMLDLPNGQVLVSNATNGLRLYTPDSAQLSAYAPNITDIKGTAGSTFTLTGTQLNGFSEGAAYGDDAQMASNYPIVSLYDGAGHRWYARTSNWNNVGVGTGSTLESVKFSLPSGLAPGAYGIQVSANGVISNPAVLVFGTTGNDTLTMNTVGSEVSSFVLNGTSLSNVFGGQGGIYIGMEGGTNTINILNTYADTPVIIASGGIDTINLSNNGNAQGLLGSIRIDNAPNYDTININNSADTTGRTVTLDTYSAYDGSWGSIAGLTPGGVYYKYSDTHALNITNGAGNDTTNVLATDSIATTSIDGFKGNDQVNIGTSSGSLSGILGPVSVSQSSTAGSTSLVINDQADTTARTVAVTSSSFSAPGLSTINYTAGQVGSVSFLGGSGGNTFNVTSTGVGTSTTISPGGGANNVNVQATSGALSILNQSQVASNVDTVVIGSNAPLGGGSLAGIAGPVSVANQSGKTALTIDDNNDSTARTYGVTSTALGGTGLPLINYSSLSSLTIIGGSGGNTFNVTGTQANTTLNTGALGDQVNIQGTNGALSIEGGNGADTVTIGSLAPALGGTLAGIAGPISITNSSGSTALIVDDSGDTTARNSVITNNSITGLAAFPIAYTRLSSLTVRTPGAGGSSTNVQSTVVPTSIIGNSPIAGPDDTALVGNAGSVAGIAAALSITNPIGFTSITVDGSADTAAETVAITNNSISGIAPAVISYIQNDSHAITINSGTGGNTFNVTSTGSWPTLTINTGAGADVVNVGDASNTLDAILGNISVVQGAGSCFLTINDQGSSADHAYTLAPNSFTRAETGTISFTGVSSILINGGIGNDTYGLTDTPSANVEVNDFGGGNTLSGPNVANAWLISATNAVSIGSLIAFNMGSLVGGSDVDTFIFTDGATLTGSLDGQGGLNTIDQSAYTSPILADYSTGTITGVGATFANIGALVGGTAANALKSPDVDSVFNVVGTNAGSITGVATFSKYANLFGGAGNDTFKFAAGAKVTGNIDGGAGNNTLDVSLYTTPVVINLANSTATVLGGTFSSIQTFLGGTSSGNQFVGSNAGSVYNITAANTFNTGGQNFVGFGNVTGGTGNDSFVFSPGATISGKLIGGGGSDTLNLSAYTTATSVNLVSSRATGLGGTFAGIQSFIGGTNTGNLVAGPNVASTYLVTAPNTFSVGGLSFSGFGNITAGSANDSFVFSPGATLSGNVNGGGGTNTLDLTAYTTATSVNLVTSRATGLGGTFSSIQSFIGGSNTGNLVAGPNAASTFNITAANAFNVGGVTFARFGNITGGSANEIFVFSPAATLSGILNGGGGLNTMNLAAYTTATGVNLLSSRASGLGGTFASIQSFIGGTNTGNQVAGPNVASTYNITAPNTFNLGGLSFTGFGNITGGSANDSFVFSPAATLSGILNGGGGINTMNLAAYTTATSVNLLSSRATGLGGTFASIQSFIGGTNTGNQVAGPNVASTFNITAPNTFNLGTLNFSGFGNITGGTANDSFVFSPAATLSGIINGGGGTNTIDLSAYTTATSVNLASSRATGLGGTFASIQAFKGGTSSANAVAGPAAATTFNITALNTFNANGLNFSNFGTIVGGAGENSFVLSNGAGLSGTINGGSGGTSWLDYSAYTTGVTVNLATGSATGFGSALANIAKVRGGSGNDKLTGNSKGNILIGGAGNDTIIGGSGRSVLIGGTGIDTVTGGSGDDIVIGGSTTFDNTNAALDSILAEWQSTTDSYATRINFLKNGGGANGTNKLTLGTTVIDDLAANVLTGSAGNDWFFKGTSDSITDLQAGEQVN